MQPLWKMIIQNNTELEILVISGRLELKSKKEYTLQKKHSEGRARVFFMTFIPRTTVNK